MPVHLYGQPADMAPIAATAARHRLAIVEDAAQAHGARCRGRRVGTLGIAAGFSFYPTKNLGAFGDASAVVTDDSALAASVRRWRNYGSQEKYRNEVAGVNSRLDELQPANAALGLAAGSLPASERLHREVLSLPLWPQITEAQQARVAEALREGMQEIGRQSAAPPAVTPIEWGF